MAGPLLVAVFGAAIGVANERLVAVVRTDKEDSAQCSVMARIQ